MNANVVWTPEKAQEFTRLYVEYSDALMMASLILRDKGMESPEFREADAAVGVLWSKLRELQGMRGKHWMA